MNIDKVSIRNYRSIRYAKIEPSTNVTTLIGANNEGKSNVLRAIKLGLSVLEDVQYFRMRRSTRSSVRLRNRQDISSYDWYLDFPVAEQNNSSGTTMIRFDLSMSHRETETFKQEFGININGKIPITLEFGRRSFEISIPKQGKGKKAVEENSIEIAKFISRRLRFVYIPAIRTADVASKIFDRIISRRLDRAEAPVLARVERELDRVRKNTFLEIEDELKSVIETFLPELEGVKIMDNRRGSFSGRTDFSIEIDDGNMTSLYSKGDGVQSLASIALMRSPSDVDEVDAIFAIEEPEAHLHSDGVHKVREIIDKRPENSQLFLTTHSPIFVQRGDISANIIVDGSEARPATSVDEIRKTLGVRPPENLTSCSVAVLCEGEMDCEFIRSYLLEEGGRVSDAIQTGEIAIIDIDGAGNLSFHLKHYLNMACSIAVFVDNDQDAENSLSAALDRSLIHSSDVRKTASEGRSSCELEDMYRWDFVKAELSKLGYEPDAKFKNHGGKFSVRLKDLCKRNGTVLQPRDIHEIKRRLASLPWEDKKPDDGMAIATLDALRKILHRKLVSV